MKFHKTLLIIALAGITQSAFAAKMSIYNNTSSTINIVVSTTKGILPVEQIPAGNSKSFDSGLSSFTEISWMENNNPNIMYKCFTPSTKLMLTGRITINNQGHSINLNFNENGASSNKR